MLCLADRANRFRLLSRLKIHGQTAVAAVRIKADERRSIHSPRQPGDPGFFEAPERRGGHEDPWLCVADFCQVCLYDEKKLSGREALSILGYT